MVKVWQIGKDWAFTIGDHLFQIKMATMQLIEFVEYMGPIEEYPTTLAIIVEFGNPIEFGSASIPDIIIKEIRTRINLLRELKMIK